MLSDRAPSAGTRLASGPAEMMRRIVRVVSSSPSHDPGHQLVRYGVVAGCGYLLAISLYSGELAIGIAPYVALGIAFVLNGLFNFILMRMWAFPPSGRPARSDLARFWVVAAVSFVLNYTSFAALYSGLEIGASVSQRLAILIAAPITFLLNRLWSFRSHRAARS